MSADPVEAAGAVDAGDGLTLTVGALLVRQAQARGDHPWVICDDDVLTYAEAEVRSAALAKGLLATGVGPGHHVALLHANTPGFILGWLAAARLGAVTLPLSTFCTADELRGLVDRADVGTVLAAASVRGRDRVELVADALGLDVTAPPPPAHGDPSLPALRQVVFDAPVPGAVPGWAEADLLAAGVGIDDRVLAGVEAAVSPADRMLIVHTSGSTGVPKGVIHQHGPLIRHLHHLNQVRHCTAEDIVFSTGGFFWIAGIAYNVLGSLEAGATLVASNANEPAAVLDLLERTRPTMVNGFAATVAPLAADPSFAGRDLTSIRRGNLWPILPEDIRPADPELRHNLLGLTETGSVCLGSDDESDQPEHRRGSFGRPVPGFEARVVDLDRLDPADPAGLDAGPECEVGQVGELWLRSPLMMEGYYGRERHETFTPDGWFRTGDLFHRDGDGFLYFHGRADDLIKTAGANVSPREVEAAIATACGLVSHVVGVADAERGQVVVAAVRVPGGADAPDLDELRKTLRQRLSAYKVPRRFVVLADDEVPVLSSGKLDRTRLEERLAAAVADDLAAGERS